MSDLGLRIVEAEPAPCQHLHSSNYDPAKVVKGEPIQILGDGRLWCFDCEDFFIPQIPSQRYTLEQIKELAKEFLQQSPLTDKLTPELILSSLIAWLAKREREGLSSVVGGG